MERNNVKIKIKELLKLVTERLTVQLREENNKLNKEAILEQITSKDALCNLYKDLRRLHPEFKDEFSSHYDARVRLISPSYRTYINWQDEKNIKDRIIEFVLKNESFTLDDLYNYATIDFSIFKDKQ